MDICLEVSKMASKVYLSRRKPVISPLPDNVIEVPATTSITSDGIVTLDNGDQLDEVDAIILCTGFDYSFPFLDRECGITVTNHRVQPLYKHLINPLHPSMALVGLNFQHIPFLAIDTQVKFIVSMLLGEFSLPSKADMLRECEEDFKHILERGWSPRYAHCLPGQYQWDYYNDLASFGGFYKGWSQVTKDICDDVDRITESDFHTLRSFQYRIIDENNWDKTKA